MSPRHVHAAAFTVLRIAHLGQAAALQVVATALEMAFARARLRRNRKKLHRGRQRDNKHSHDLVPFSPNQPSSNSKPQSPPQVNEECRKIDQVFGLTKILTATTRSAP